MSRSLLAADKDAGHPLDRHEFFCNRYRLSPALKQRFGRPALSSAAGLFLSVDLASSLLCNRAGGKIGL
jgi:hypothetical protein